MQNKARYSQGAQSSSYCMYKKSPFLVHLSQKKRKQEIYSRWPKRHHDSHDQCLYFEINPNSRHIRGCKVIICIAGQESCLPDITVANYHKLEHVVEIYCFYSVCHFGGPQSQISWVSCRMGWFSIFA